MSPVTSATWPSEPAGASASSTLRTMAALTRMFSASVACRSQALMKARVGRLAVSDGATLVRGVDPYNNFEHEPTPAADMAPEAIAFHRFAIERLSRTVMAGTDKNIAERR